MTQPTRVPEGKKKGPTDTSDSPTIRPCKEGALHFQRKVSTPSTARLGESHAPTASPPTSLTPNSEDLKREHWGKRHYTRYPPTSRHQRPRQIILGTADASMHTSDCTAQGYLTGFMCLSSTYYTA